MKTEFNEVELFRQLASDLKTKNGTRATLAEKVHGRSGWVNFDSLITNKSECVEIADLLIINYNKKEKEVRICFLQAKRNRRKTIISFQEDNSALQFELLRRRCKIEEKNKFKFPADILRFTNYKTITSYGIFYADNKNSGNYDFVFSVPESFYIYKDKELKKNATIRAVFNKYDTRTNCLCFPCDKSCSVCITLNCLHCLKNDGECYENENENTFINHLGNFENVLCNGKIGAPITNPETPFNVKQWLANLLITIKKLPEADNLIIDEISKFIGDGGNNNASITDNKESSYMNTLLIVSGENQEKETS